LNLTEHSRIALYYAPRPDDPLFAEAATWLGRDPESGAPVPQLDLPGIEAITADARLYGFHATLRPPMGLPPGTQWQEIAAAAAALADGVEPFDLPMLAVADVFGFLALRETEASMPLQALADLCVASFDRLRLPRTEPEADRRRRADLTPAQSAMLARWGYPWVFGTWYFHMTLTRGLSAEEKAIYLPAAEHHFARALLEPRRVDQLCLFVQQTPDQPFLIAERFPLRG
jgi:uncharacterized protein DUF1045